MHEETKNKYEYCASGVIRRGITVVGLGKSPEQSFLRAILLFCVKGTVENRVYFLCEN